MMPPASPFHSSFQAKIAGLLQNLMTRGEVFTECAISTADGVKAADIAWAAPQRIREK